MTTNVTTSKKDINATTSNVKDINAQSQKQSKTDTKTKNNVIAQTKNNIAKLTNCTNYTQQFYTDYCTKNKIAKLTEKHAKQCRQKQRTFLFKIVDNVLYTNAKICTNAQIQDKFNTDKTIVINFMIMYKKYYLLQNFNANNMFKGGEDKIKLLQMFLNNVQTFLSKDKKIKTDKKTIEQKTDTTQQ